MSFFRFSIALGAFFAAPLFSLAAPAPDVLMPVPPALAARAWVLMEFPSGQVLGEEKADEQRPPASLTKLMSAYLVFSALRRKTLTLSSAVKISEKAWKSTGSRMFARVDETVPIDALLKGMIIQSGNDASIALAEAVAGSEEAFAAMMNREAERLGMKRTHFVNATGLPHPDHYSTARDLSALAAALIRDFPDEYARYYSMKEFSYQGIKQANRNRLLWLDESVDGMKTGFTESAGFCLIASSRRGERRLLSVVMGTDSDAARAHESLKLLNWGYQSFDAIRLYRSGQSLSSLRVWKGGANTVKTGFLEDFLISVPKHAGEHLEARLMTRPQIVAPIRKGQTIGVLKLSLAGHPYGEYPVRALEDVPMGSRLSRFFDSVRLWFF
ncbi:MAG: D-alanyl-D-alanine carboxypeptidase [Zoogloeaceae bacterium]|jgi:D-alanyl-D-alanine carboxypeptidase (penicillin-binding protein 5/6)|nr:D-alanyl-D-alanine carboxypeptidase [Zoogloeaceae bacterium]